MNLETYKSGSVIFQEGDTGDCMYSVESGVVGIFLNYGKDNEIKISEFYPGKIFGEMGMLENEPRSATAVALENDTTVEVITENSFFDFFGEHTFMILEFTKQMCNRLRKTTSDYLEACETVCELQEAGSQKSEQLMNRINKFAAQAKNSGIFS